MNLRIIVIACLLLSIPASWLQASGGPDPGLHSGDKVREWRFRVLLDDREIGQHRFLVTDKGHGEFVESEARFDVRILFFNAYSYQHSNVERWRGGCLEAIQSATTAGKERYEVRGLADPGSFRLETGSAAMTLDSPCVRSFAYWDRTLLDAPRLLNSQTGEWVEIRATRDYAETIRLQGQDIAARRYDLEMPDGVISLWYGPAGRWLALSAPAPGGRTLRYLPERIPDVPESGAGLARR